MEKLNRAARPRTLAWIGLAGVLLAIVALIDVRVTGPRVAIQWSPAMTAGDRAALEGRYGLRNSEFDEGTTWRYDLGNRSRDNIGALIHDAAVLDTGYIDREALTARPRDVQVTVRSIPYPFRGLVGHPSELIQLRISAVLLLAGGLLLWAARAESVRRRRNVTVATLLIVGVIAIGFQIDPSFVTMGAARDHLQSRANFEHNFDGRVRFEKHLSQTILLELYHRIEPTDAAPERALVAVTRGVTAWFVLSALLIGFMERWSPLVLRYLGLALLAPATLMYFGWREFGYFSLSVAAFPLLARGLRDGNARLEAGSALTGLGTALHGSGLLALAGSGLAALGTSATLKGRVSRALRVAAWGTAAYLGWTAIYVIVLKLEIAPDPGPGFASPWRPWFVDDMRQGRLAAAILSGTGARDVLMSFWIVGAPLLVPVLSLWRRYREEVRAALWYLPPSIVFVIVRWPFEGLGGGTDLIVAGFPALYALAWVCAHDSKRTTLAAALLVSAHFAFWQIMLDPRFQTKPLF
ncbi:MAG: hypothetical protein EXQ48_05185 [Acidobacteria bacterium]|nr:hypothetical protein [Acidobacteriota bacterium]